MKLILLVEDETDLADTLVDGLEAQGYRVHHVERAEKAFMEIAAYDYDALIVDWMLPDLEGPDLVHALREDGISAPVLMLTVRDSVQDRVKGLDRGADDYLTKPFSFEELLARLRALLRRPTEWHNLRTMELGPLSIDTARRTCSLEGTPMDVRKKEFDLLRLLAERSPAVVPRTTIAERVWGSNFVSDNAIDVTVSGLRKCLQAAQSEETTVRLETVRGVGYRLDA